MTKAIVLLLKLYDLNLAGKGDSEEAESVRSDLDAQWRSLTKEEKTIWINISSNLPNQQDDN
jgi:hypothetical protein